MSTYATIEDLEKRWRTLTSEESTRAETLLSDVESILKLKAKSLNKDIDIMSEDSDYKQVLISVICDIVKRILKKNVDQEALSQFSQSAGGYTFSGTYLVPNDNIYIMDKELKRLGLKQQKMYGIDLNGYD